MGANWNDYFINLPCYGLMLPESLRRKKIATICGGFWVPTLPYENNEYQCN